MNELQRLLLNEMGKQFGDSFYVPEFNSEVEARQFIQSQVEAFVWEFPEEFDNYSEEEICKELGIEMILDIVEFDSCGTCESWEPDDEWWDSVDTSTYEDKYEPGDDFETDYINSLE